MPTSELEQDVSQADNCVSKHSGMVLLTWSPGRLHLCRDSGLQACQARTHAQEAAPRGGRGCGGVCGCRLRARRTRVAAPGDIDSLPLRDLPVYDQVRALECRFSYYK